MKYENVNCNLPYFCSYALYIYAAIKGICQIMFYLFYYYKYLISV